MAFQASDSLASEEKGTLADHGLIVKDKFCLYLENDTAFEVPSVVV